MNNQSKRATWTGGTAIGTPVASKWAITPPHSPNNQQHSSSGGNWRERPSDSWRSETSSPQSNWRNSSVWNSADYSWSATPRIPTPPGFSARPQWSQQRDSWDAVTGISSREFNQQNINLHQSNSREFNQPQFAQQLPPQIRDFNQFSQQQIPSWDTKPIISNVYNPRDVRAPVVQAGWGAPPAHTTLKPAPPPSQSAWHTSPPFSKQQSPVRHAWDTEVVKINDLAAASTRTLRKTKSTASFFDPSSTPIVRGRVPREERRGTLSRQIDQINRNIKPVEEEKNIERSTRLFVYGFPSWVRVRELIDIFCDYGSVLNDPTHAYVDFERPESVQVAIRQCADKVFFDMSTPLEMFDAKRQESSTESKSSIESTTIHLGNTDVEKLFSQFGTLKRVQIVSRPREGRIFAFIGYKDAQGAKRAMASLRNSKTRYFNMDEPLKMEYSKIERKKLAEGRLPFAKNILLVPSLAEDINIAEFESAFSSFGIIKNIFHSSRRTPSIVYESNSQPLQTCQKFALVEFESEQSATSALEDKLYSCLIPRQRRITIFSSLEDETLISFLERDFGKILRISATLYPGGRDVEFNLASAAVSALVSFLEKGIEGIEWVEFSSSVRKDDAGSDRDFGEKCDSTPESTENQGDLGEIVDKVAELQVGEQ